MLAALHLKEGASFKNTQEAALLQGVTQQCCCQPRKNNGVLLRGVTKQRLLRAAGAHPRHHKLFALGIRAHADKVELRQRSISFAIAWSSHEKSFRRRAAGADEGKGGGGQQLALLPQPAGARVIQRTTSSAVAGRHQAAQFNTQQQHGRAAPRTIFARQCSGDPRCRCPPPRSWGRRRCTRAANKKELDAEKCAEKRCTHAPAREQPQID